jgi:hypothetical protein
MIVLMSDSEVYASRVVGPCPVRREGDQLMMFFYFPSGNGRTAMGQETDEGMNYEGIKQKEMLLMTMLATMMRRGLGDGRACVRVCMCMPP